MHQVAGLAGEPMPRPRRTGRGGPSDAGTDAAAPLERPERRLDPPGRAEHLAHLLGPGENQAFERLLGIDQGDRRGQRGIGSVPIGLIREEPGRASQGSEQ